MNIITTVIRLSKQWPNHWNVVSLTSNIRRANWKMNSRQSKVDANLDPFLFNWPLKLIVFVYRSNCRKFDRRLHPYQNLHDPIVRNDPKIMNLVVLFWICNRDVEFKRWVLYITTIKISKWSFHYWSGDNIQSMSPILLPILFLFFP